MVMKQNINWLLIETKMVTSELFHVGFSIHADKSVSPQVEMFPLALHLKLLHGWKTGIRKTKYNALRSPIQELIMLTLA